MITQPTRPASPHGSAAGALSVARSSPLAASGVEPATTDRPATTPSGPSATFAPDLELELRAAPAEVALLPGAPTTVWRYEATVLVGDPASVQAFPGGYLGPTIRVHTGRKLRVHFVNDLPDHDMGGMTNAASSPPPQGAPMTLLRVRVTEQVVADDVLPQALVPLKHHRLDDAVNRDRPRRFVFTQPAMRWEINGRVYEPDAVMPEETLRRGDLEVWELVNAVSAGETMHPQGMLHPFHIHGTRFQVIGREVLPELAAAWGDVRQGYIDDGRKDTVLLMPGERVRLLVRFAEHTGTYMVHCHILEHEDMGMMCNIEVVA